MLHISTDGHQVKLCSSQILTPCNCKYITNYLFIFVIIFCTDFVYIKSVGVSQCNHVKADDYRLLI